MVESQTNSAPEPKDSKPTTRRGPIVRFLMAWGRLIVRLYALVVMLVIMWAGYASVAYLVRSVFTPIRTPPQFTEWAATLNVNELRSSQAPGVSLPAPRAPLGHFHIVDRWFEPDPHNNCTLSGCHLPLPHTKPEDVRAFANFHVTFLACQMCHEAKITGTTQVVWVNKATGKPESTPAILQLLKELETDTEQLQTAPASRQATIVGLLRQVTVVIPNDPLFEYLLIQLETTEPGSPVWRQSVEQLKQELPNNLRGEYRAKLMTREDAMTVIRDWRDETALARRFQTAKAGTPEREKLYQEIHEGVAKQGSCLECHGEWPTRLNYDAVGYSLARQAALRGLLIAQMMQQIRAGHPFYLPGFIEPGGGALEQRPSTQEAPSSLQPPASREGAATRPQ